MRSVGNFQVARGTFAARPPCSTAGPGAGGSLYISPLKTGGGDRSSSRLPSTARSQPSFAQVPHRLDVGGLGLLAPESGPFEDHREPLEARLREEDGAAL